MRERSLGVTTLAFASVMVALFCQFAAVALIMMGSIFAVAGSVPAVFTLVLGAVFLGLTFAAYFQAYGFWTGKHWSWAGGVTLFVVFAVANVVLSAISSNFVSTILPGLGAIVAVWYLHRPAVKAELLGQPEAAAATVPVAEGMKGVEPAH